MVVQIALGGLVAGSKAGWTYNTWPLMDGRLAPPVRELFAATPLIENFVDNVALVQFNHRLAAYVFVGFALGHAFMAWRRGADLRAGRRAGVIAGLALAQMGLGILTLILVVPLWAGLLHQVFAMVLLGVASAHTRLCRVGR